MLGDKKNIIVGAASVHLGPSWDGTGADPAPATVNGVSYRDTLESDATYTNVGFTSDGLDISSDPSFTDVNVDQLLDAAKIFKDAMSFSVSTTFAEATLENLLFAWGQSDDTLVSGTLTISGGALGDAPLERGLIAVGNGKEKTGTNAYSERVYKMYRVLSVEGVSTSLSRDEAQTIPVTFRCLPDNDGDYGTVVERLTT
jgi:hypothetical protein